MARWYVGQTSARGVRETFRAESEPTAATNGDRYAAVIGPFRTRRGAEFMCNFGGFNPHCATVADAERLARLQERPTGLVVGLDNLRALEDLGGWPA